ncbi:bobby sox isoform 1-T4 [Cochliomyia hominivorax]
MINSFDSLEFLKTKIITMDKFNCPATTKLLPPSSLTQTRTFVTISGHHHQELHHLNNNSNNIIDSQKLQKHQDFLVSNEIKQQQEEQERVKVQHVENHTKLQNNICWNNFRTLNYTTSASFSGVKDNKAMKDDTEIDVVNVDHLSPTSKKIIPINIQQQSAFNLDLKNNKYLHNNNNNNNNNISICVNKNYDKTKMDSSRIVETNNNKKIYNQYNLLNNYNNNNQTTIVTSAVDILTSTSPTSIITQRTEDQNNAYRHIESVHNYAKSKSYEDDDDNQSPNGSRHSSYLDDDDDDEEDDEEDNDNDVDYDHDEDIDYEERLDSNIDDLDADYEHIFNRNRQRRLQKLSTSSDGALLTKSNRINNCRGVAALDELKKSAQLNVNRSNCTNNSVAREEDEIHVDVDVETVESQSSSPSMQGGDMNRSSLTFNGIADESPAIVKPDHHARRPMNAFLIFCKRHRAIVKERYKNLENRAITKILGDWWASLDANDKQCFTNLAQQNKDAFFSANPNFKWYKLPAPPLRTLSTRPATNQEYQEDNETNGQETISNNNATRGGVGGDVDGNNHSNYFKLADEAQMGDLSQLMQDKTKTIKQCADLQQALGETSQFMSAHITGNSDVLEENHLKRRYHNENSFSSNSSEDDVLEPKRKTSRSCKGKRYQELINSGQIATAVKKSSKSSTERLAKSATGSGGNGVGIGNMDNAFEGNLKQCHGNINNFNNKLETSNICQKRSISECENLMSYDLNGFDLEERIKELPALNLDDYLQRKRNTKKKKKFSSNGKKRGQRSSNHNNNNNNNNESNLNQKQSSNESLLQKAKQQNAMPPAAPPTAVGSQKRKARKESITRRDVSAIEQEVASLLPLTINGCCYLQAIEKDTETTSAITPPLPQTLNVTTTSPIIPLQQKTSTTTSTCTTTSSVSIDIFNNNNSNNTLNDNISSSTSDLLILAEVAANRTEL